MWFLLSLSSALFAGTSDALAKTALKNNRSETVAWVKPGWGLLVMVPIFLLSSAPSNPKLFWESVAFALPMEVAASLMFQKSIQLSPLSISVPYLAFTPVFLLLEEWLFTSVRPTLFGVIGVGLVTLGAFFIQIEMFSEGKFSWHRLIPREKGPLLMLSVAFIFSITTIFARRALNASSPFYFSSVYYVLIAVGLLPFQFNQPQGLRALFAQPSLFLALGCVEAFGFLVQFQAMAMAESAYVIAIKRLSLLFSVFFGWLLFNEHHIRARLLGASLMALGAAFIAFA